MILILGIALVVIIIIVVVVAAVKDQKEADKRNNARNNLILIIYLYGKRIKKHIGFVENILKEENSVRDWDALSDYNRMQIGFFQHERLVHLLITFFSDCFMSFLLLRQCCRRMSTKACRFLSWHFVHQHRFTDYACILRPALFYFGNGVQRCTGWKKRSWGDAEKSGYRVINRLFRIY